MQHSGRAISIWILFAISMFVACNSGDDAGTGFDNGPSSDITTPRDYWRSRIEHNEKVASVLEKCAQGVISTEETERRLEELHNEFAELEKERQEFARTQDPQELMRIQDEMQAEMVLPMKRMSDAIQELMKQEKLTPKMEKLLESQ